MASTSTSTPHKAAVPKGPAPWKKTFLEHINKLEPPEFVLSTVAKAPEGSDDPVPYLPRARFCIFRGFWAELPPNPHNPAPLNPRAYASEMPTFTTDVRMAKVPQLFTSSAGHADSLAQTQGSGGGGPVEAVWWVKELGTQWRIRGRAFVVGPDIDDVAVGEGGKEGSSGVRTARNALGERMMGAEEEGKKGEWRWGTEVNAHFGNMAPGMRGMFRAPPPGQRKDEPYNDKEEQLGTKVEDLDDALARRNFRVVVIRPDEVEQTDISDPNTSKRYYYTYDRGTGEWKMEELWP